MESGKKERKLIFKAIKNKSSKSLPKIINWETIVAFFQREYWRHSMSNFLITLFSSLVVVVVVEWHRGQWTLKWNKNDGKIIISTKDKLLNETHKDDELYRHFTDWLEVLIGWIHKHTTW